MSDDDAFKRALRQKREKSASQGGSGSMRSGQKSPAESKVPSKPQADESDRGRHGAGADPGGNPGRNEGKPPTKR